MSLETLVMVKPLPRETRFQTFDKYGIDWKDSLRHQGVRVDDLISEDPMELIIESYLELCTIAGSDVPFAVKEPYLRRHTGIARGLLRFNTFLNETLYIIHSSGTSAQIERLRRELSSDKFTEVGPLNEDAMARLNKALTSNDATKEHPIFDRTQHGFGLYFDIVSEGMYPPIRAMMVHRKKFEPPIIYAPS